MSSNVGRATARRHHDKVRQALDGPELRQLLERDFDLARLLDRGGPGLRDARRLLTQLSNERERLSATMAGREVQLDNARGVIEAYDRPLVRRRHSHELESARNQLDWIPRSIEGDRSKLGVIARKEQAAFEAFRDAYELSTKRPELLAERSIVQHHLREDVRARGDEQAIEPSAVILRRIGPMPSDPEQAAPWRAAAGQIAQHREAYGWNEPSLLEPEPLAYLTVDAYSASHEAARQAIDQFDRSLGRGLEIETPHRELGIELSL